MAEANHPLTEEHYQSIIAGLDKIKSAEEQIKLAKMAGIDVRAKEAEVATAKEQLSRIRQVYFPGR